MTIGSAVPHELGSMPTGGLMITLDEQVVRAPAPVIFRIAADVERWPTWLPHYRHVHFRSRTRDGGGVVEMSANRPFGPVPWPTWWTSLMSFQGHRTDCCQSIRFRHIDGITTGMEVEWSFEPTRDGTHVRVLHVWNGPQWPVVGALAARAVIGPLFVHGIASRTLAGLARIAERQSVDDRARNWTNEVDRD